MILYLRIIVSMEMKALESDKVDLIRIYSLRNCSKATFNTTYSFFGMYI